MWAVFLVAIIERGQLMDPNEKWFDMFRVLFELVSAFGGIGLSLGFPNVCYNPLAVFPRSVSTLFRVTTRSVDLSSHCRSWL